MALFRDSKNQPINDPGFLFRHAKGEIGATDTEFISIIGSRAQAQGANRFEALCGNDSQRNHVVLGAAANIRIQSSNANDTAGGSGIRSVRVNGIDGDNNAVSEVVTLSGTTALLMTNQLKAVNNIVAETVGANGVAAGDIITYQDGSTDVMAMMHDGDTVSASGMFFVPNGYTAYMVAISTGCTLTNDTDRSMMRIVVTTVDGVQVEYGRNTSTRFSSSYVADADLYIRMDAGEYLSMQINSNVATGINAAATAYLVISKNEVNQVLR